MAVDNSPSSGTKHAGGRPPKLTPEQKQEVCQALSDYITNTPDPTIVGFVATDPTALKYDVTDDNINDWEEFTRLRKRAVKKQEWYLLEAGGRGRYNPTMAIFRLKQPVHGYTDKQLIDQNNTGEQKLIIETRKYGDKDD